jgi:hypothetical protein
MPEELKETKATGYTQEPTEAAFNVTGVAALSADDDGSDGGEPPTKPNNG